MTKKIFLKGVKEFGFVVNKLINYNCFFLSLLNNVLYISKYISKSKLNISDYICLDFSYYIFKFYLDCVLIDRGILNYYMSDIFCKYQR